MQQQYLRILRRLLELRRRHVETLNEQGLDLLDRCIVAALAECRDAGVGEEARAIISSKQVGGTS